jgi:hypothetical protein
MDIRGWSTTHINLASPTYARVNIPLWCEGWFFPTIYGTVPLASHCQRPYRKPPWHHAIPLTTLLQYHLCYWLPLCRYHYATGCHLSLNHWLRGWVGPIPHSFILGARTF